MRRVGRRRGDVLRVPLVRDIDAIERIDGDDGDDGASEESESEFEAKPKKRAAAPSRRGRAATRTPNFCAWIEARSARSWPEIPVGKPR